MGKVVKLLLLIFMTMLFRGVLASDHWSIRPEFDFYVNEIRVAGSRKVEMHITTSRHVTDLSGGQKRYTVEITRSYGHEAISTFLKSMTVAGDEIVTVRDVLNFDGEEKE